MSDELTLFLFNFITFDFVLVAGLAMIASADDMVPEAESVEAVISADRSAKVAATQGAELTAEQPQPAVVEFTAPRQPKSKKLPPRKPSKAAVDPALPRAPRKPGVEPASASTDVADVANAPSRIKAPSKPKKRF